MKNIFYFKKICAIGGTEQFLYEIAKKYNKYDITVYYDEADKYQLQRLRKYVRCRKHIKGEIVKCEKAFFNFNLDMINDVEAKEYYFVSHANFQELGYKPPISNDKLTHYIGVSKFASDKLVEYAKTLGKDIKVITSYNPLSIESKEEVIHIVSAGRIDDKVKGGKRTLKLIEELDKYCEEHNRHYVWTIFSNPLSISIPSKNVVVMQRRVDVRPYIADADYVVQLSNDMETFCYTTNEAWSYGVHTVTTPFSVNKELPIPEGANIVLEYDCSNVKDVARQIFENKRESFTYIPPKDSWDNILDNTPSTYKEDSKMKNIKVKAIINFVDIEENVRRSKDDEFMCTRERLEELLGDNPKKIVCVKVIEEPKQETTEEDKPKKKKTTKKK